MKVGLIPPRGLENLALRSRFHLALAIPELMERPTYGGMYRRLSLTGDFVVLDNGLAEGKPALPEEIVKYAKYIDADEVVLPDVMKDGPATIAAVQNFLAHGPSRFRYMAVPQGLRNVDYFKCVETFAAFTGVHTIGIPRHMLTTLNKKSARIDFAHWINENFPKRFELHLLGTNPVWLNELKHASKYAPFIRSVDSSMPFSYALAHKRLGVDTDAITRPEGYFETDWTYKIDTSIVRGNIITFMEWANAAGVRTETSASKLRNVSAS